MMTEKMTRLRQHQVIQRLAESPPAADDTEAFV